MSAKLTDCVNQALFEYALETDLLLRTPVPSNTEDAALDRKRTLNMITRLFDGAVTFKSPLITRSENQHQQQLRSTPLPAWCLEDLMTSVAVSINGKFNHNTITALKDTGENGIEIIEWQKPASKDILKDFNISNAKEGGLTWLQDLIRKAKKATVNLNDKQLQDSLKVNISSAAGASFIVYSNYYTPEGGVSPGINSLADVADSMVKSPSLTTMPSVDISSAYTSPLSTSTGRAIQRRPYGDAVFCSHLDGPSLITNNEHLSTFRFTCHPAALCSVSRKGLEVSLYNWGHITRTELFHDVVNPHIEWIRSRMNIVANVLHQKAGLFNHCSAVSSSSSYGRNSVPLMKLDVFRTLLNHVVPPPAPEISVGTSNMATPSKLTASVPRYDAPASSLLPLNRFKKPNPALLRAGTRAANIPLPGVSSETIASGTTPATGVREEEIVLHNILLGTVGSQPPQLLLGGLDADPCMRHCLPFLLNSTDTIEQQLVTQSLRLVLDSTRQNFSFTVLETLLNACRLVRDWSFPLHFSATSEAQSDNNIHYQDKIKTEVFKCIGTALCRDVGADFLYRTTEADSGDSREFYKLQLAGELFLFEVYYSGFHFGCNMYVYTSLMEGHLVATDIQAVASKISLSALSYDLHLRVLFNNLSNHSDGNNTLVGLFSVVQTLSNLASTVLTGPVLSSCSLKCYHYETNIKTGQLLENSTSSLLGFIGLKSEAYNMHKLPNTFDNECRSLYVASKTSDFKNLATEAEISSISDGNVFVCVISKNPIAVQTSSSSSMCIYIVKLTSSPKSILGMSSLGSKTSNENDGDTISKICKSVIVYLLQSH